MVLHRCPKCDHCFTDVESLDHLGEYDADWEAQHENWFANPNIALFDLIADTISRHKRDASVIDIGAGRGELLAHLRERVPGLSLAALDVSLQPQVDGVEVIRGDINSIDLGGRRWDVAVSLATIEHLADVRTFAERLRSVVAPGGLAIVSTNNERSVTYDVARLFRRIGYDVPFERLYDRHHLNHFNIRSLGELMDEAASVSSGCTGTASRSLPWTCRASPRCCGSACGARSRSAGVTGRTYFQTLVLETRPNS